MVQPPPAPACNGPDTSSGPILKDIWKGMRLMNYSFDTSDIEGGADGPRRYRSLPENLVQTLRRAVDRNPAGEACR